MIVTVIIEVSYRYYEFNSSVCPHCVMWLWASSFPSPGLSFPIYTKKNWTRHLLRTFLESFLPTPPKRLLRAQAVACILAGWLPHGAPSSSLATTPQDLCTCNFLCLEALSHPPDYARCLVLHLHCSLYFLQNLIQFVTWY